MKKMIAEYKQKGKSIFIPVDQGEFTKDVMPVNQQEDEDVENGSEEAARFAAWDQQQHDRQMNEFETYK